MSLALAEISLDQIVADPNGPEPDDRLIESVARFSLLRALHARVRADGRYALIEGRLRLEAARRLLEAKAPALVEPVASERPAVELQMVRCRVSQSVSW